MNKRNFLILYFVIICTFTGCVINKKEAPPSPTQNTDVCETTPAPESTTTPVPVLLGSAKTTLLDKQESRLHNIRLACQSVNGSIVEPGNIFSFNQVVGNRTPERGYQDATVLVHEEKQKGCGGGVCQVSSTVYQAAQNAGLVILERNSHSGEVGYAPKGEDAAVNYGDLDMRFKNNCNQKIKIKVWANENAVQSEIYQLP